MSSHSAGEPGASRCSDEATGSSRRAVREAQRRARWLEQRRKALFPCEPQAYGQGAVSGLAFLGTLLSASRDSFGTDRQYSATLSLRDSVAEVGRVMDLGDLKLGPNRQHAAYAFMNAVAELLVYASRFADFEGFLNLETQKAEDHEAWWAEHQRKQKAEFVERMREARAAKRRQGAEAAQ